MDTTTDQRLDERLRSTTLPVLVDFWADWCPPCRAIAPIVAAIARERHGVVEVTTVDVDAQPDTAALHEVASLPTLVLFVGAIEQARLIGAHPKGHIDRWLDETLGALRPADDGADSDA